MTALKIRPDNLDFIFGINNKVEYYIPSLVLVQSILENNLWANQIQISIFYENLSPEQKNAYEQLIDNFNKSQGKNFAILNLFDKKKLDFEFYVNYKGSSVQACRVEGLKFVKPISNWIFSLDGNSFNIKSLEPLINQLNSDYSSYWAINRLASSKNMHYLDGSYYTHFEGPMSIFNTKFFYQKNGILEKYLTNYKKILATYHDVNQRILPFYNVEVFLGMALQHSPVAYLKTYDWDVESLDSIPDSVYFVKRGAKFAPWYEGFPDNSLKKQWLGYASKHPLSNKFQCPHPRPQVSSENSNQIIENLFRAINISNRALLHWIGKISPKTFQKLFKLYLNQKKWMEDEALSADINHKLY